MLGRDRKAGREDFRNHTLIAPSARVCGDIEFTGGLHVQGQIEGNICITSEGGRLVIGETGSVKGEIRVPDILINGRVEGDVHASGRLELAEKAVIEGNVYYNLIEMVVGAQVNGKLVKEGAQKHLPSPEKADKAQKQAVRDSAAVAAEANT